MPKNDDIILLECFKFPYNCKKTYLKTHLWNAQIGDDQKGWKANGWTLDKPDWTGKLRLTSKGTQCVLKLEEKASSGKEFAHVEVDTYPGPAVQTVTDSSR